MTKAKEQPAVPAVVKAGGAVALPSSVLEKLKAAKPTDDFSGQDLLIPWLTLVQTSSGYMKRNHENYIAEAREGDIIDTLSKRLRPEAFVILVRYETHYTEWKAGGGSLVKQWFGDSSKYDACGDDFGKRMTPEGNEISPSRVYYVLDIDLETGRGTPMVWSLGGTQAKKYRRINSLARADVETPDGPMIPPIYWRIFKLTSRGESGDDGKSWAGWVAEPMGFVLTDEEGNERKHGGRWYAQAEAFREQIVKGAVRPTPPVDVSPDREDSDDAAPVQTGGQQGAARKLDDDIPF